MRCEANQKGAVWMGCCIALHSSCLAFFSEVGALAPYFYLSAAVAASPAPERALFFRKKKKLKGPAFLFLKSVEVCR